MSATWRISQTSGGGLTHPHDNAIVYDATHIYQQSKERSRAAMSREVVKGQPQGATAVYRKISICQQARISLHLVLGLPASSYSTPHQRALEAQNPAWMLLYNRIPAHHILCTHIQVRTRLRCELAACLSACNHSECLVTMTAHLCTRENFALSNTARHITAWKTFRYA